MEKVKPGRPLKEVKKIHTPRVVILQSTIDIIRAIAEETGRSQSSIYQEALDAWIENFRRQKRTIKL